jgi:hypothetical protein
MPTQMTQVNSRGAALFYLTALIASEIGVKYIAEIGAKVSRWPALPALLFAL